MKHLDDEHPLGHLIARAQWTMWFGGRPFSGSKDRPKISQHGLLGDLRRLLGAFERGA